MAIITFKTKPCLRCGKATVLELTEAEAIGVRRWQQGELIQRALPDMPMEQRELLITGTHPECWKIMFPPEEDDL